MPGRYFPKDPFRREKPHDTIKRVSIGLSGSREFIHRLLAAGQKIGEAEFDNDAQRLRHREPES
jgi:hypothetical protein